MPIQQIIKFPSPNFNIINSWLANFLFEVGNVDITSTLYCGCFQMAMVILKKHMFLMATVLTILAEILKNNFLYCAHGLKKKIKILEKSIRKFYY